MRSLWVKVVYNLRRGSLSYALRHPTSKELLIVSKTLARVFATQNQNEIYMAKKKFIGDGPSCPRCRQISKLYRRNKIQAFCENFDCPTKNFPAANALKPSDRVQIFVDGPPCARCERPTIVWRHSDKWVPTPGKPYYEIWYECKNETCLTKQIMPREAYVTP